MNSKIILVTFMVLGYSLSYAQDKDTVKVKDKVKPKFQIKIRQSFQSADSKPEPAAFTYTKPKDGKESYLVDAALGLKLINRSNLGFNVFGEYHRNTLIDKEQNVFQTGLSLEWFTNKNFTVNNEPKNNKTSILNFNAKYSNNYIDKTQSIQFTGEITPLFSMTSSRAKLPLPNSNNSIGKIFDFQYFPSLGFENQYNFQAKSDSSIGNILRGVAKFYLGIKPLPALLNSKLELFGDFTERYNFINSTKNMGFTENGLIQVGLNFIIFDDGKKYAKIGGSFNKGSNPGAGLINQEFYIVSLKVKI